MRATNILVILMVGCASEGALVVAESPEPMEPAAACLELRPQALWFGEVEVGKDPAPTSLFSVRNGCEGDLEIQHLDTPDDPFHVQLLGPPLVPAGQSSLVSVSFVPTTAYGGPGALRVGSNGGSATLPLHGQGIAPVLSVVPEVVFDQQPTGCTASDPLRLTNTGSAQLVVEQVQLETGSGGFELHPPKLPLRLQPGASVEVGLDFTPLDDVGVAALVRLHSSDPSAPEVVVPVHADADPLGLVTESHQTAASPSVDVVWVLDRSG